MVLQDNQSDNFESSRLLLTIHHWKSWFSVNIPMVANVSEACGEECVLQRYYFDDNTVLNNGYSINEYPSGTEGKVELGKLRRGGMERCGKLCLRLGR